MPRKGTVSEKQDYKYVGVLYTDTETYNLDSVLQNIKSYFSKWSYCVHDKDVDSNGELKKSHIHWVGIKETDDGKNSPVSKTAVADAIGVPANYIDYARSVKNAERYLIHADDDDKYQYDFNDIKTNHNIMKYFKERREMYRSAKISDYIISTQVTNVSEIMPWIFENNLYSEFRRGYAIWHTLVRENEEHIKNRK